MRRKYEVLHGVLVLDKPQGMSSAEAVDHVKARLNIRTAGHGGTLDPLATGVLPICLGEAMKLAAFMLADDKAYEADLVLGAETDTLDRTGQIIATRDPRGVTREMVERVLQARTGEHDQMPPMFSAIKVGGTRLYARARAGEEVERATRKVRIDQLELLEWVPGTETELPRMRVAITCSKGTYVRSLIADIGNDLGCGAHMTELRRTRSGDFTLAQAHDLNRLDHLNLVPIEAATRLPTVLVGPELITKVRHGIQMKPEVFAVPSEYYERFLLVDDAGRLIAMCHVEGTKTLYDRVFLPPAGG